MTLREYNWYAGETDNIAVDTARQGYYYFGLIGESGELYDVVAAGNEEEIVYEAGDVMWYCVRMLWFHGGSGYVPDRALAKYDEDAAGAVDVNVSAEDYAREVMRYAAQIAERVKKVLRNNRGIYRIVDRDYIVERVFKMISAVALIANKKGLRMEEICEKNIDKLASRQLRGVIDSYGDHR